ncbi:uroporphyrinogen-III C-methyltransferase [Thalassotalea crassostreae]|uniref:uroporphyrinogen-III C-methyltransferase n=1 Tax=Thalassotalea crassostreae TaxID=1763536 RepID=UPI000838C3D2|nr:uroporphyrinogen-III C-methyltransferase [Thalassotalea crassostreae]
MTDKDNNKENESKKPADNKAADTSAASKEAASSASKPVVNATKLAAQAKSASQQKSTSSKVKSSTSSSAKTTSTSKPVSKSTAKPLSKSQSSSRSLPAKQKISKTAILALLVAITAGGGVGAHYWWQEQQSQLLESRVTEKSAVAVERLDQHLQQQISKLQTQSRQQISALIKEVEEKSGSRIKELENQIQELIDSQPANWQIVEAEYLVRMAGRVLWLQKDAQTAISLIEDADARLKGLRDPRLLEIRELLHQDIEKLQVLPKLERDDIVLSLMGLSKQVDDLPLASVELPDVTEIQESTALSEDISDWRENLSKSWQQFKDEFITIRRRKGDVEPLMEPKFEQNLYHNFELKFQQAQWAVTQGNTILFRKTVTDMQLWLSKYFDMTKATTQQFNARLGEVKNMEVNIEYPKNLQSAVALQKLLKANKNANKKSAPIISSAESVEENNL